MTTVLAIEGLSKTYRGGVRANDGVTLSAEAGEVGNAFPLTVGPFFLLAAWCAVAFAIAARVLIRRA